MENSYNNRKLIAGGPLGWGGLIDRGNRIIPPNCASDLLNVWDNQGTIEKRKGYTKNSGTFILCGAYEETSTGSVDGSDGTVVYSQEVLLDGTNGDISFNGLSTVDMIVAFKVSNNYSLQNASFFIYTSSGGYPQTLKSTGKIVESSCISNGECWIYVCFSNVLLGTSNICITVENLSYAIKWYYSNTGYAPGGSARKAAKFNGSTWSEISGVDFLFKVYFRNNSNVFNSVFQYNDLLSNSEYGSSMTFTNNSHVISGGLPRYNPSECTAFIENELTAYSIMKEDNLTSIHNCFPYYSGVSGLKKVRLLKSKIILGTSYYLFETSFNNWPKRIYKSINGMNNIANNYYRFANTSLGLVICPDKNAPQVWGTTAYPISGYTGAMSFTGLTNPITIADTVMWHKERLWLGNVTINGTNYPNRIYYSGINAIESGYADNSYITVDGKNTALLDVGDYAVLADYNDTYYLAGAESPSTSLDKKKHDTNGGVYSQEAICVYKDANGYSAVYGWGNKGIFQIQNNTKVYLHDNIVNLIDDFIISDIVACPDYKRQMVLFSYLENGARKILGYNIRNKTWWKENLTCTNMTSVVFPSTPITKIYGISGNEWWDMYSANNDGGTAITEAYYKCGPNYANNGGTFVPARFWIKTGNEPVQAHLHVRNYNNYGDEQNETKFLRNGDFPDNVPVLRKTETNAWGTAISNEVCIYQDACSTTVNADSNSGQKVLSVASVLSYSPGMYVIINQGGAREEIKIIDTVDTSSITLTENLTYTHTAVQADIVQSYNESFKVYSLEMDIEPGSPQDQDTEM